MKGGQKPEQRVVRVGREHVEAVEDVGEQIAVGEGHRLGGAFGSRGEEKHRRVVLPLRRQGVEQPAGCQPGGCRCAERLARADRALEILEKDKLGTLDLKAQPVDELSRTQDPPGLGHADAVGQGRGAGRPVEHHRNLARQMQPEERQVGRHAGRQHHPDMRLGISGEAAGHQLGPDPQPAGREHARHAVGRAGLGCLGVGPANKCFGHSRGQKPALPARPGSPGRLRKPLRGHPHRPSVRVPPGKLAVGQGPELPERLGHRVAAKTELLLDPQGKFHPIETVEPEVFQPRGGGLFAGLEVPFEE